jgi:hypothetical protein
MVYRRPRLEALEPKTLLTYTSPLAGFLTGPQPGKPLDIALGYLAAHASDYGMTPADIGRLTVTNNYTDAARNGGATHIYLRQGFDGIHVDNAKININITRDGQVVNVGGGFDPALGNQTSGDQPPVPALSASQAVVDAAADLGIKGDTATTVVGTQGGPDQSTTLSAPGISLDKIPANLAFFANPDGSLTETWHLVIRTADEQHWYEAYVDATTGKMTYAGDWVDHYSESYNVFALPTRSPDFGGRQVVTNAYDTIASPFGWQDTNGAIGAESTLTQGNNAIAYADTAGNDQIGFQPDGGSSLNFNFPLDLTQDPSQYQSAAITDLYYWNNISHDFHYQYGFDEASGNFQVNNYGHGGLGGDPVLAEAQDGSGVDNANFATPPDGQSGRMQMFVFDLTNPKRDGDLDPEIMVHEYGHGVSTRLTGGPADSLSLQALQSGGMGEGWSDFWSTAVLQAAGDNQNTPRPQGTYVLGQPTSGGGVRRVPYSYDMTIDPETIDWFNATNSHFSQEVHDVGEIWTSTLWDMYWNLINKYGYNSDIFHGNGGNNVAFQLVMEGLKLQPANPSFKDARDAILEADQVLTGGQNQPEIWGAFARRGMGLSFQDANSDATSVVPAFDVPLFLSVRAATVTGLAESQPSGTITVATFTDPDTTQPHVPTDYTATINWGDGTGLVTGTIAQLTANTFGVTSSHDYIEGGKYKLIVTITKANAAGVSADSTTVSVADAPLSASPVSFTTAEGAVFSGPVATFTDADPSPTTAADYTVTIDWGDGTASSAGVVAQPGGPGTAYTVSGAHAYALDGTYTPTVKITDAGGATAQVTPRATVTDVPLSATGVDVSAEVGVASTNLVARLTDANPLATEVDASATVNWGDGTASAGTIQPDPAQFGVFDLIGTHTYRSVGRFMVHTVVTSTAGFSASADSTAVVTDATITAPPVSITATEGIPFSGTVVNFTDANVFATADQFTATITWGDGASTPATVIADPNGGFDVQGTHTYATVASYNVSVAIRSVNGSSASSFGTAVVVDAPLHPTGVAVSATEGQPVTAAVATFTDANPLGKATDFTATIDWGDGTTPTAGVVSANPGGGFRVVGTHTYASFGASLVSITIIDSGGSTTSTSATATVADAALTASSVTFAPVEGQAFSGVVASFNDANPNPRLTDFSATITWGDGSNSAGTVVLGAGGVLNVRGTHTFGRAGSYPVGVAITDLGGSKLNVASTANVADAALTAAGVTISLNEGVPFTGVVATFTDANPSPRLTDFSAAINWGDGTNSPGTISARAGGGFTVTGSHAFRAGNPAIMVVISDAGGATATASSSAVVADVPITAAGDAIAATEGAPFNGEVASFTDANPLAQASDYTATIAWGDGTTSPGSVTQRVGGGFSVVGTHRYEDGHFNTSVTIQELGNSVASASGTAAVADAPLKGTIATPSATEGTPVSTIVASFTDANPNAPMSDFSATINWGDGTPTTAGTIAVNPSGGYYVEGTHTYGGGTYTLGVAVSDVGGNMLGLSGPITVKPAPLTASGVGVAGSEDTPLAGAGGTSTITVANFTDTDPSAHPTTFYHATIDWGDGTTTAGTIVADPAGGFDVQASSKSYASPGHYTINVSIADINGDTTLAPVTATAVIADAPLSAQGVGISGVAGVTPATGQVVATFTDADSQPKLGEFSAMINWGDGTAPTLGTITFDSGSGVFSVAGTHAYPKRGSYPISVSIGSTGGSTASATSQAVVADAPITANGLAVAPVAGLPFTGAVATFSSANALAQPGDFAATIAWGDGTTTVGTVGIGLGGGFSVSGNHTYARAGARPIAVSIASTGGSVASAQGLARISNAPLTLTPSAVFTSKTMPFSAVVATIHQANLNITAADFSATIAWGDGTSSVGQLRAVGGGAFSITGSHAYAATGVFRVAVAVTEAGGGSGATATSATVSAKLVPVTGTLNPLSDSGVSHTDGITNIIQPNFVGTADPGSTVRLFGLRAGSPGVLPLGQGVAGLNGIWTITTAPLVDGSYTVVAASTDVQGNINSPLEQLLPAPGRGPLVIDTVGPRVTGVSLDPLTAQVHITFQDDLGGLSGPALLNPANYSFGLINRTGVRAFQLGLLGVTPAAAAPTAPRTVTAVVNGGRRLQAGGYVIQISALGITDAAGNMLVERFFVPFPFFNQGPGSPFIAEIDTDGVTASPPRQFVPPGTRRGTGTGTGTGLGG